MLSTEMLSQTGVKRLKLHLGHYFFGMKKINTLTNAELHCKFSLNFFESQETNKLHSSPCVCKTPTKKRCTALELFCLLFQDTKILSRTFPNVRFLYLMKIMILTTMECMKQQQRYQVR